MIGELVGGGKEGEGVVGGLVEGKGGRWVGGGGRVVGGLVVGGGW